MDIMDLRTLITVVSFVIFVLIIIWAYGARQRKRFDEAANLPFADEEMQQRTIDKVKLENAEAANSGSDNRQPSTSASRERSTSNKETSNG